MLITYEIYIKIIVLKYFLFMALGLKWEKKLLFYIKHLEF